jgi:hypothetical protein
MNGHRDIPRRPDGALDEKTRLKLGLELRAMYNDFVTLNLPQRLVDLLDRLGPSAPRDGDKVAKRRQ